MPELPEVENVRISLERLGAIGQEFADIELLSPRLRTPLKKQVKTKLPGQTVLGIRRRAKYLMFETEKFVVLNHLGMTGSWRKVNSEKDLIKHDHVIVTFRSGLRLAFNDPRRFGLFELIEKQNLANAFKSLGVEPLSEEFTGDFLFRLTRGLKAPIKNFIMDQRRIVGVGNIYASEALYRARVKPTRRAGKIKLVECENLVRAIRDVLTEAIAAGGSTIRDYRDSNGDTGRFQQRFLVYDKSGEPCTSCRTPIRSKMIGGRNTYWCPKCQH